MKHTLYLHMIEAMILALIHDSLKNPAHREEISRELLLISDDIISEFGKDDKDSGAPVQ